MFRGIICVKKIYGVIDMLKKSVSLVVAFVLAISCFAVSHAENDFLFSVRGTSFTSSSTIDNVVSVYGAEKLKTKSIFGGWAYSFYDNGYSNYLYVETNAAGRIASYSVFGEGFSSSAASYGDREGNVFSSLTGDIYSYDNKVWGVTGYCRQNITGSVSSLMERYEGDIAYAEGVARHAVLMWNAVSVYFGKAGTMQFDSRTFYTNRQLMEGGSNFYYYTQTVGRSNEFALISAVSMPYVLQAGGYLPNPGMYAEYARNYTLPEKAYPVFDYSKKAGMIVGAIRETYYAERAVVPYTEQEKQTLERVRQIYNSATNWSGEYFDQHPQDETLPLTPGKVSDGALNAALCYLNAIRVGAGLPELELSEELCRQCQYKAVLTSYISKSGIDNPSPHYPPQPDGVTDEFYNTAQACMNENLYHGNVVVSIMNALDDSYGDPVSCGHRYNLLDPYWRYVGFGSTEVDGMLSFGVQGVHKMDGHQACDAEIVAWPSKGIMINEANAGGGAMFSARFYNRYSLTENSGVIFKCLNTGETFYFSKNDENTSSHKFNLSGYMVSYYDRSISMSIGDVYEITITNVTDSQTGNTVDYSYRSVYENAFMDGASSDDGYVAVSQSEITLALNQTKKVNAAVSETNPNKMVHWSTSDAEIATVNENGFITGHGSGSAVITAYTDSGAVAYVNVTVGNNPFTDLTLNWYKEYIDKVYENGIMNGMTESTFEPDKDMSRGMFVTVLARMDGVNVDNNSPTSFSDVQVGRYFTGAVAWANANDIVFGITSTTFKPNDSMTREQMCAMIIRYVEYKNIALNQDVTPAVFSDAGEISNYAKGYVESCQKAGFIAGMTPTTFVPKGKATRAQVAKLASLLYDYIG